MYIQLIIDPFRISINIRRIHLLICGHRGLSRAISVRTPAHRVHSHARFIIIILFRDILFYHDRNIKILTIRTI
jgi:hypothetical protein